MIRGLILFYYKNYYKRKSGSLESLLIKILLFLILAYNKQL